MRLEEVDGRLGLNVQSAFVNFEAGTVDSAQNQWFTKAKKNRYANQELLKYQHFSTVIHLKKKSNNELSERRLYN